MCVGDRASENLMVTLLWKLVVYAVRKASALEVYAVPGNRHRWLDEYIKAIRIIMNSELGKGHINFGEIMLVTNPRFAVGAEVWVADERKRLFIDLQVQCEVVRRCIRTNRLLLRKVY